MVKRFSVDWLARSHFDISNEQVTNLLESTPMHFVKHIPCVVQQRPPTCKNKICSHSRPKCIGHHDLRSSSNNSSNPTGCASPRFLENSGCSPGYESEAVTVEGQSIEEVQERESAVRIHRRARTKFTSEQIYKLEKTFNKHKYLDPTETIKTAEKLKLSETQVRTWFQNRRMKRKREVQDCSTHHFAPTVLIPAAFLSWPPAFQHHDSVGQRLPFIPTDLAQAHNQHPMLPLPTQHAQQLMHPIYY